MATILSNSCLASVAHVLIAADADVNATNRKGETPLITASRAGRLAAVQVLIDAGAEVHARTVEGRTALMEAAKNCYVDILSTLIGKGSEINGVDRQGYTAWDLAFGRGHEECVELLQKHGAISADETGEIVYIAPYGDRYHKQDGPTVQGALSRNQLVRKPVARARAEGYDPCQRCWPGSR